MAGSYPDALDNKIAYDDDGSVGFSITGGGIITPAAAGSDTLLRWNDFTMQDIGPGGSRWMGIIFSVNMDITAIFYAGTSGTSTMTIESSTDTTNGQDGTWNLIINRAVVDLNAGSTLQRTGIFAVTNNCTNIKAIRFSRQDGNGDSPCSMHIYGHRHTLSDLVFWHPTIDQALRLTPAQFDFADIAKSSSVDKTFRIKNAHGTQTANGVVLSSSVRPDATPTIVGQVQFSQDGTNYANTQNIGNLAPGAISPVLHIKDSPSSTAQTGLWYPRAKAAATSWS